jgi:PAS domain S-box-containing protein
MNTEARSEAPRQTSSRARRFAWLPVPIFLAAIAILFFLDPGRSYEQPRLLLVLNLVSSALPSVFVAYLCAQSFLARGVPGVLLLGCGVLLWGAAGMVGVAAGLVELRGPNFANTAITIHNSSVWLSAVCQLAGAVLLLQPRRAMREPGLWLSVACTITLGLVGLVTLATLGHWTPTFFVQGRGGTPLRQFVLGSGTGMFVLTSVLLWLTARRTASSFAYWFSLAQALIAVGLLAVMEQSAQGSILGWTGRAAQFLGSAYMLGAAIVSTRESRAWGILVEEALRASEKTYRNLFENIQEMVTVYEVERDDNGQIVERRVRDANSAFLRAVGVSSIDEIRGKTSSQIFGKVWSEAHLPAVQKAMDTGQVQVQEVYRPESGRRYITSVVRLDAQTYLGTGRDITERMQAEEALRESETKYRNLFENMAEEVHFWKLVRDEEGRIKTWRLVDANPPTLKTWGRTLAEIQGKTTDEIFGPGATEHYMPVVQKIMTDRVPYVFEDYFPNLGKHFRFTSVPLGEYFITTGADITQHKRAEGELRKSSEALQAANAALRDSRQAALNLMEDALAARQRAERTSADLQQEIAERRRAEEEVRTLARFPAENPNPVLRLDSAGGILHANAASAPVLDQWGTTVGGHAPEPWRATVRDALGSGSGTTVELACADRTYIVFVAPVSDAGYVNLYMTDITERKASAEALRESQQDLNRAQAVAHIGSWRLNVRRNELSWSDENWRIFGVPRGTPLTYETFLATLHPEDRDAVHEKWSAALRGEPYDIDHRIVVGDTVKWVREQAEMEFDHDGKLLGGFGTTQDITQRKESEELIKASLREKEVLLKEIHHRVKNNLQVVSSLVRLQADGLDDPRLRDLFRDIHDRVQSMALVHERLYRSESLAEVDFGDYARSLLSHLWRSQGASAARIQLKLDLDPVSLSVETAVPCGLILNELAGNAFKHAFAGRAAGGVTVSLHTEPDGRVRLCVGDDGAGLPQGLDWRQARSLGLRLVQMLATQINGAVEMRSGAGTEFAVTFTPPVAAGKRRESGEGRP